MNSPLIKSTNITLAVMALIAWAVVTYWAFWPYIPLELYSVKVVNEEPIIPGEMLIYELDFEKKMKLPTVINRQLVNGFVITYSPLYANLAVGKKIVKSKIKIPNSAEPGKYRLKWQAHYKVNPIREIVMGDFSNEFIIASSE